MNKFSKLMAALLVVATASQMHGMAGLRARLTSFANTAKTFGSTSLNSMRSSFSSLGSSPFLRSFSSASQNFFFKGFSSAAKNFSSSAFNNTASNLWQKKAALLGVAGVGLATATANAQTKAEPVKTEIPNNGKASPLNKSETQTSNQQQETKSAPHQLPSETYEQYEARYYEYIKKCDFDFIKKAKLEYYEKIVEEYTKDLVRFEKYASHLDYSIDRLKKYEANLAYYKNLVAVHDKIKTVWDLIKQVNQNVKAHNSASTLIQLKQSLDSLTNAQRRALDEYHQAKITNAPIEIQQENEKALEKEMPNQKERNAILDNLNQLQCSSFIPPAKTVADLKNETQTDIKQDENNEVYEQGGYLAAPRKLKVALKNLTTEQEQAINAYHQAKTANAPTEVRAKLWRDVELWVRDEEKRSEILDNLHWLERDGRISRVWKNNNDFDLLPLGNLLLFPGCFHHLSQTIIPIGMNIYAANFNSLFRQKVYNQHYFMSKYLNKAQK